MPPALLEDDVVEDKIPASDSDDNVGDIAPREKPKTPAKQLDDDLREAVGDDAKDDSDDEEEEEYVVEKIEQHKFESNGSLVLLVRWDGYDEPTWEPEANMTGCPDELDTYYISINGRPTFQKKGRSAPSKRASTATAATASAATASASTPTPVSGGRPGRGKRKVETDDSLAPASAAAAAPFGKRGRKRTKTETDTDGPATAAASTNGAKVPFELPADSWEDELLCVEAMERQPDGRVMVMVEWRDGLKTKHFCEMLHNMAPKLMCKFYFGHLQFPVAPPLNDYEPQLHGGRLAGSEEVKE